MRKTARRWLAPVSSLALILLAVSTAWVTAAGPIIATIDIDTTATVPIQPGFSGINDDVGFPVEYWDSRFNALAAKVGYGWVRFPGGSSGDVYNWQTGEEVQDWYNEFAGDTAGPKPDLVKSVAGKGGARMIDAVRRADLFGASLIVCANAFTDTPQSIGQLAAYAKANQIPVSVWELANEAYLFPGFFPDATTYLNKMKPYRDAIKVADPKAVVAIFARDPGIAGALNSWDSAIAAYPDKYWDAVTFHHYPPPSSGDFSQWMADESGVLASKSTALITDRLAPISPPGMRFLISEFDPTLPVNTTTGAASLTDGTLWGGIYVAEFIMRMSTVPSVLYVGPHAIWECSGVLATNAHYSDVTKAADAGKTIDTTSLDFGFYLAAQANGLAVLNGVINQAVHSNSTTVTGGVTVPATGVPLGQIPALYAMSYTDAAGGLAVVVTNKSATPHSLIIRVNGRVAPGPLPVQFVTATDPSTANTPANPTAVTVQSGRSTNPVTVPPYCVMRVDVISPPRRPRDVPFRN